MTRHIGALIVLFLAVATLTGCGGGGSEASTPTGWKAVHTEGLTLAYPSSLSSRPENERAKPKAALELEGPQKNGLRPPTLFVFVERGPVGSLRFREDLLIRVLKDQLPNFSFQSRRDLEVPGALAARVLEFTFTSPNEASVPWRQVEVLIQTRDGPQYGIRYGAPSAQYDEQMVKQLLDTLRVQQS